MPPHLKRASALAVLVLRLGLALVFCLTLRSAFAAGETTQDKLAVKAVDRSAAPHAVTSADGSHATAPAHESAGGHGVGEPNILEAQFPLAIFTVIVFLGLMGVLGKFAWKPLISALHNREDHFEHVLLETERARNESEQLLAEHRRRLAAAEDQVRALIEEARKSAQSAGDEIVKRAQSEAEASKVRAVRDISSAKDQALTEIWSNTADLAVSVAGKVLKKSLTEDDHRRLVESAIAELPASPQGRGGNAA